MQADLLRCDWSGASTAEIDYHDNEWGRLVYDDRAFFERLSLELMQAGLSWATILNKRDNFRKAFDNFEPEKIAKYDQKKIDSLLEDTGIVRNKLKINAIINNAKAYLKMLKSGTQFRDFFWQYVNFTSIQNCWKTVEDVPASTDLSKTISNDLKKLEFKFVGPTIVYSLMQATGMVNDHLAHCFLCNEISLQTLNKKGM